MHGSKGFEMMRSAFPDLVAQIDDVVAADDKVALRLRLHGTHHGELQGISATGGTIRYVSHEFYRVRDGLFAEEWICSDTASLFRQLAE
jgi:predicted ester cyclase